MAEAIAGAALGGMALASTSLSVQAAGNLMNQVGRMGRMTRSRRSKSLHKHLDAHRAVFGKPQRRTSHHVRHQSHTKRRR